MDHFESKEMELDGGRFESTQQSGHIAFEVKQSPAKPSGMVEATATASALADISAIISQQFTNFNDGCDDGVTREFTMEHPCFDYLHKCDDPDAYLCRICSRRISYVDTQKAIEHFSSCHPQIAAELEHSWQMKTQPKASVSRSVDEPVSAKETSERRGGHGTEHPCWRYFTRNRKSADCRMCGTHVAYACSGNLMRHLRSRHSAESVVTQKEWEEIQKRKKQLCEMRMMATANACASEEQSPSNAVPYTYVEEEQDESLGGTGDEYSATVENDEQKIKKDSSVSSCHGDIKVNGNNSATNRDMQACGTYNVAPESTFPRIQHGSWSLSNGNRSRIYNNGRQAAFQKRVNSFVSGLTEELVSFPMQKSLFCMRRIRKFMDEQLLELDEVVQNSEDDAGI